MLRSADFRQQAGKLPGYDTSQAGTIVPVDTIMAYGEVPATKIA